MTRLAGFRAGNFFFPFTVGFVLPLADTDFFGVGGPPSCLGFQLGLLQGLHGPYDASLGDCEGVFHLRRFLIAMPHHARTVAFAPAYLSLEVIRKLNT